MRVGSVEKVRLRGRIKKSTILNVILFFCFFPFFKLVPWITAEVQPWGALLAFLCLFVFSVRKDRVALTAMLFFWFLLLAAVISILIGRDLASVVMLSAAYALPFFIFLALKDNTSLLSVKVLYVSILLYLIVGTLQSFSLLVWAERYVQLLIPRFLGRPNGLAGRGVSFLAQEPSGAGFIMTLMIATASYFYLIGKVSGRALVAVILAVAAMLVMNRSGTAFLLVFCLLAVFGLLMFFYGQAAKKAKTIFLLIPVVPLIALIAMWGINRYSESAKFVFLLHKLLNMVKAGDLVSLASLAALSGGRFVTVLMGYVSLSERFGLGHGIAAYQTEYSHLSVLANVDWSKYSISNAYTSGEKHKPNAYGAQIALDMGIEGLALIAFVVIFCWMQKGKRDFWKREGRFNKSILGGVFATAAFIIFLRSTTAMPVAWVMLAYVHDYIKNGIGKAKAALAMYR